MASDYKVGDHVVLERSPDTVRADDPEDDIFRQCLGLELEIVRIEDSGDLELDVRKQSDGRWLGIFVPADCVRRR